MTAKKRVLKKRRWLRDRIGKSVPAGESTIMWLLGILGCLCFGAGDWLLGFVDPGGIGEAFRVIRQGNGADYDLSRVTAALFLGALGMVFLLPGFRGVARIVTDGKRRSRLGFTMSLCAVGWLLIHFTVSAEIYAYSWCMHKEAATLARDLTLAVMELFRPAQLAAYLFVAIPLLQMFVYILNGHTVCGKGAAWFHPVVWMAFFAAAAKLLPPTPFANGLDTFCMNAGMIVWFGYLLICIPAGEHLDRTAL